MAIVRPFCGVRPAKEVVAEVAALPYDVYNREEAVAAVQGHPLSFLNIDRAETQFDASVDTYADCVYAKAKEMLDAQIADGTYVTDATPCFYVYRLIMDGRAQTGIVGCSSVDDYVNNVIKKHENTRADKEQDRIRHVDTCSAQTGPIFLAYRSNAQIAQITKEVMQEEPLYDFTADDGISHTIWKIADPVLVARLSRAFETVPNTYIADGHHRAASAVKVGLKRRAENPGYTGSEEFNFFLSVLFPEDELMILPYNRVVADLCGRSVDEFLKALTDAGFTYTKSEKPVAPTEPMTFGMFLDETWYVLKAAPSMKSDDPVKGLDVSVLQDYLLDPILGIKDPRVDKRIDFIGGIRGLSELERRVHTDMTVAFSMYATTISQLFDVADAGLLMPPKSTWFEPKLRSGLLIHKI